MDDSIQDWLERLAARTPTPGGGAVAALSAAIAAAQLSMVALYTTGSKWQESEARMLELSEKLMLLRKEALGLVRADAEAFARVGDAYKLPKESDMEKAARTSAIQQALAAACEPPVRTAKLAKQLVLIAQELVPAGNPNVISDVVVGTAMACGALESAIVNIEINERELVDDDLKRNLRAAVQQAEETIAKAKEIIHEVRERIGGA